jgi:hypothetical protein
VYDPEVDNGTITLSLAKKMHGQVFPDLDMLTSLYTVSSISSTRADKDKGLLDTAAKKQGVPPLIEVLSSTLADTDAEEVCGEVGVEESSAVSAGEVTPPSAPPMEKLDVAEQSSLANLVTVVNTSEEGQAEAGKRIGDTSSVAIEIRKG